MKYIIWDWNGTLLDDIDAAVNALNRILAERGIGPVNREEYRSRFRFPVRDYYIELGIDVNHEWDRLCTNFHRYFEEYTDQHVRPDAETALRMVRNHGVGQSILSALMQDLLLADTAREGVAGYFDEIFGTDNLEGSSKLSRAHELMEKLGLRGAELYLIGDTTHDAEVAAAIGTTPILIASGHQHPSRLRAAGFEPVASLTEAVERCLTA